MKIPWSLGCLALVACQPAPPTSPTSSSVPAAIVSVPAAPPAPERPMASSGFAPMPAPPAEPTAPTALVVEDLREGKGRAARSGDTLVVHYRGSVFNGALFEDSITRGAPLEFVLGRKWVIAGWEQGLVGMRVGGQRELTIPPQLGYGERGAGPIPPNATLVFQIELIDIK